MTAPGAVGGVNVGVGADASEFTEELESAMDEALRAVVDAAGDAFSQVSGAGSAASQDIERAARDAARATTQALGTINLDPLEQMRVRAAQAAEAVASARQAQAQAARNANTAEDDLLDAIRRSGRESDEARAAAAQLAQARDQLVQRTRDAARAQDDLDQATQDTTDSSQQGESAASSLGTSFGEMTGKIAGAVVGLAGLTVGLDAMMESFDRSDLSNKLRAQLDLTAEESAQAGKIAGDLYANNYGESFEQVNEATGAVLSTLGNLADDGAPAIEALTAKALTLSSAFGVDVAEAANTANIMIRNGLAKDGPEAFDLIGAAMQRVPAQMRDELIPIVDEYSTYLNSMGFTGQEAMGIIVNAAQDGAIGIDKAGDAIKEFGIRATDLGDKGAVEALQSIGLEAEVMSNDLLAGGDVAQRAFQEIVNGLLEIENPAEQAAAATALFGTPLEDLDKNKIPGFLRSLTGADSAMGDFTGTVDEMGTVMSEGPGASLETFKRQLQDTVIDVMGKATQYMLDHTTQAKILAGVIGGLAAIYITTRVAAVGFAIGQGIAAAASGAGTAALAGNTLALGAYAIAQGVASAATAVATGAVWLFNAAIAVLTSPITLIVVGIGLLIAAIVLLWKKNETFRNIVLAVWDAIKNAFQIAWEFIQGVWDGFLKAIQWVGDKLSWFWAEIVSPVLGWIGAAFGALWDYLSLVFRLWGAVFEVVGIALQKLWENVILPVLGWIGDKFLWIWDSVISPVFSWIGSKISEGFMVLQFIWDTVVLPVMGWIGDKFMWLYNEVIAPVGRWIGDRLGDIGGFFTGLWDKVLQVAGWIMGKLGEVTDFFGGIKDKIFGALGDAGKMLWDWGKNLIQGLLDGAGSLLSKIGDFFLDKIPGWIKDPFKKAMGIASPSKVFIGYGKNLGEGLIAGTEQMTSAVQAASQDMANAAGNVAMPDLAMPEVAAQVAGPVAPAITQGPVLGAPTMDVGALAPDPATVLPAWDATATGITDTATNVIDPAMLGLQAGLTGYADTFPAVNDGVIQPALTAMGTGLLATKDTLVDPALWGMQGNLIQTGNVATGVIQGTVLPQWGAMGAGIMGVKQSSIDPAFAGIQGGLQTVQGAFATGVGAISSQWDQMRGAVGRPVRFAIDTVFNNGLVGMWNSVSELLGTQKMNPYVVGGFASGTSVLPGYSPGRDNMRFFTPDGSTAIDLSGGEGIARPEVVRALGPDKFDGLNAAASRGGVGAVQKYLGGFASGGIIDAMAAVVGAKFPGMSITSTYRAGDPGYHGKGMALDFSNGFDSTPGMRAAAAYIAANYPPPLTLQLIHQPFGQNIGQGQGFVGDGMGFYGGGTMSEHRNHVHWATAAPVSLSGGSPIDPSLFADAGAMFSMGDYVKTMTKESRDKIASSIAGFNGQGIVGTIPAKVSESLGNAMDKKLEELASSGSFAIGGGDAVERWRPVVLQALARTGNSPADANRTLQQIGIESGGDPNAINLTDSNAAMGDPSVGLLQIINGTFQTWRDRSLPDDRRNPLANIVASMRYAVGEYGSLASIWPKTLGYDLGGVANGIGFMPKMTIKPERVLSPEMTESFDQLLPLLANLSATGSGRINIGGLEVSGNGTLRIGDGRGSLSDIAAAAQGNGRQVIVTQYITGSNAQEVADETSRKLIALL